MSSRRRAWMYYYGQNVGVSPGSLNPTIWLRADLGITRATGVSHWIDQSANAYNFAQASGPAQPTQNLNDAGYNGYATLSFLGASAQTLSATITPLTQPFTIFWVGQASLSGESQPYGGTITNASLYQSGGGWNQYAGASLAITGGLANTITKNAWALVYNGASSSVYINNSQVANASGNAGANPTDTILYIGSNGGGNNLDGKIAELIFYNGALSNANIKAIFAYLGARYGIATS